MFADRKKNMDMPLCMYVCMYVYTYVRSYHCVKCFTTKSPQSNKNMYAYNKFRLVFFEKTVTFF